MKFLSQTFDIRTEHGPQFVDITDKVIEAAESSGLSNGFAVVFSKHTTAAIRINEAEPHLIRDMEQMLEQIAPSRHDYAHNRFAHALSTNGERPNGHSHCQHILLGASESVPIVDGQLVFGQWQRIFLVELDHGRDRQVVVHFVGE
ncbi:MAG: YjbQ family protein [Chloroflexi bacterium]|nr:MAG: YjbQ family protein [Chloroflexota bacterium]